MEKQSAADSHRLKSALLYPCPNCVWANTERLCDRDQRQQLRNVVRHHAPRCFSRASTALAEIRHVLPVFSSQLAAVHEVINVLERDVQLSCCLGDANGLSSVWLHPEPPSFSCCS